MTVERPRYVVGRPRSRVVFQRVILPLMAIVFGAGFLFFVWWVLSGRSTFSQSLPFLAITGIVGAVAVLAWVSERRRGGSGASLEVDARGIRVAGMPWLAWSDVAEVRAEEVVGFGGGDHDDEEGSSTTLTIGGFEIPLDRETAERRIGMARPDTGEAKVYHRLGIVPRDPSLAQSRSGIAGSLAGLAAQMRNMSVRGLGGEAIELAPFGVYDYELNAPFADVVARVRDFHDVVEASDLRAARG
jgi:hypothetical protein